eukprot:m.225114 g.225114  ORF g.225114 m.225114 type:complete len:66 (+) comp19200_c0_seq4:949-1146(+)
MHTHVYMDVHTGTSATVSALMHGGECISINVWWPDIVFGEEQLVVQRFSFDTHSHPLQLQCGLLV